MINNIIKGRSNFHGSSACIMMTARFSTSDQDDETVF